MIYYADSKQDLLSCVIGRSGSGWHVFLYLACRRAETTRKAMAIADHIVMFTRRRRHLGLGGKC